MTTHQTTIDGYLVDVDSDMGDGATGCWISKRMPDGEYSASLALLVDSGQLEASSPACKAGSLIVREDIIERISAYAASKGY